MKLPFKNIWLRVIAIIMGLLLWFHVATEKVYNYDVKLPVTELVLKENLALASETPESLSVKVSANGKHLLRQDWKKAGLRINAAQFSAGKYNLELTTSNVLLAHAGTITLDEVVQPTNFYLDVDHLDVIRVSVNPDLIVTPDDGYAVKAILRPKPAEVVLKGARSILEQIPEVTTEQKEVTGLRNNVALRLAVIHPPGQGLSLEPESVTVEIEVVPVKTRLFEKIPIIVYNSPAGKKVKPLPPTIDIEMTGPPDEINLLNRNALIASVDYEQLTADSNIPIKIDCPGRFKVKKSSAQFVRLGEN